MGYCPRKYPGACVGFTAPVSAQYVHTSGKHPPWLHCQHPLQEQVRWPCPLCLHVHRCKVRVKCHGWWKRAGNSDLAASYSHCCAAGNSCRCCKAGDKQLQNRHVLSLVLGWGVTPLLSAHCSPFPLAPQELSPRPKRAHTGHILERHGAHAIFIAVWPLL